MQNTTTIESPCISICEMDEATDLCIGCYRTRNEIAYWGGSSDDEKRAILELLHVRRVEAGGRARRQTRRNTIS